LRKLEKAKIAPPPDWLEDQVREQKMFCDSRVATRVGRTKRQPNSAAVCVLVARERAQYTNAVGVRWAYAWCLVSRNTTPKLICRPFKIVNASSVCVDIIVIQGATDVLQQPDLFK
jgi:hypothetical protein